MIRLSLIFIKLFLTLLDPEFFSLFYILLKLFVRGPLISGGAVICRLWVNKVKDCFYYHTLWLLSIFALAKNPEFSLEVMLSQYTITNMICLRKRK